MLIYVPTPFEFFTILSFKVSIIVMIKLNSRTENYKVVSSYNFVAIILIINGALLFL